jgi:hypothetical protein
MNDEDMKLEETLRRHEPPSPPAPLRARILARARDVRRQVQHRWFRRLSIAAALIVTVVIGRSLERVEQARCERLLANPLSSRTEDETKELAFALADLLDGNTPPGEMERSLRIRIAPRPSPVGPAAWQRTHQEPTF